MPLISGGSAIAGGISSIGGTGAIGSIGDTVGGTIDSIGDTVSGAVESIGDTLGIGGGGNADKPGQLPQGYTEPQGPRAGFVWNRVHGGPDPNAQKVVRLREDGSPGIYPGPVLEEANVNENIGTIEIQPGISMLLWDTTTNTGAPGGSGQAANNGEPVIFHGGPSGKTVDLRNEPKPGGGQLNNWPGYVAVARTEDLQGEGEPEGGSTDNTPPADPGGSTPPADPGGTANPNLGGPAGDDSAGGGAPGSSSGPSNMALLAGVALALYLVTQS